MAAVSSLNSSSTATNKIDEYEYNGFKLFVYTKSIIDVDNIEAIVNSLDDSINFHGIY